MDNYKKFGIVAGQVFMGLAFAILGVVVQLISVVIISAALDLDVDLFAIIGTFWIGIFLGLLTGISLDGYRFLKRNGRQNEFFRFVLLAAFGTAAGFLSIYLIVMNPNTIEWPRSLFFFCFFALPFTGAVLASILVLARDRDQGMG